MILARGIGRIISAWGQTGFLPCFATVGHSAHKTRHLFTKMLFWNTWRQKTKGSQLFSIQLLWGYDDYYGPLTGECAQC